MGGRAGTEGMAGTVRFVVEVGTDSWKGTVGCCAGKFCGNVSAALEVPREATRSRPDTRGAKGKRFLLTFFLNISSSRCAVIPLNLVILNYEAREHKYLD